MRCTIFVALLLVLTSALTVRAEIKVTEDAFTEHDYRKAVLAFNRRTLHDAYARSGRKSEKWDAAAHALFDGMVLRFSNANVDPLYRLPGEPSHKDLKLLARAALDQGCDDPLVRYCDAVLRQDEKRPADEILPILDEVAQQLNGSEEPSWRGLWAQHRICQLIDPKDPVSRANHWERFRDLAVDLIVRWKYQGIEQRIIAESLWATLEDQGPDYQQAFVKALRAKPGGDQWVREMLFGNADIKAAWHLRGGGWAHTVTDGGWAGFYRHLGQAREHLTKAWALQPNFPEAAADMITVAMGAGDQLNEHTRDWFDKAVSAQFDYAPAYKSYLWASRPRWGGTIGQMYNFGVECARTKRYDTRVPKYLLVALDDIASDMDGPQFWRQPGVYDEVRALYDGLVEHAAATEQPAADVADKLRSQQAAFAWRANRFDEARRLISELDQRFQHSAFDRFDVMGRLAVSHAFAMRPGLIAQVNKAENLAGLNDIDAAIAAYEAALDDIEPADQASFFLKSRLKQLQWQKQFETGEWVDIQPGTDLAGWCPQAGNWEVDEQGGLVGTFVSRELLWLPCQANCFRGSIVMEGDIELFGGDGDGGGGGGGGAEETAGGFGISYNTLSRVYGLFLRRDDGGTQTRLMRDFWPGARDPVELEAKNRLTMTLAGGRASATLNGKEIFRDYDVSYMAKAKKSYVGVGGRWGDPGSSIRFTNLRIRALNGHDAPDAERQPADAPQE